MDRVLVPPFRQLLVNAMMRPVHSSSSWPDGEEGGQRRPPRLHSYGPAFWFQQTDAPGPQRNGSTSTSGCRTTRPRRVSRRIAAGGHLVTDQYALAWWTLADAEGTRPTWPSGWAATERVPAAVPHGQSHPDRPSRLSPRSAREPRDNTQTTTRDLSSGVPQPALRDGTSDCSRIPHAL